MSLPERAVILSPDAQGDFTDILLYTWQQWGEEQRNRYETILEQAITGLGHDPDAGKRCSGLFPGCRIRLVEKHLLYDRIVDDTIEVVRILHEKTHPDRLLFE